MIAGIEIKILLTTEKLRRSQTKEMILHYEKGR